MFYLRGCFGVNIKLHLMSNCNFFCSALFVYFTALSLNIVSYAELHGDSTL